MGYGEPVGNLEFNVPGGHFPVGRLLIFIRVKVAEFAIWTFPTGLANLSCSI
jgi:hypothetical protein